MAEEVLYHHIIKSAPGKAGAMKRQQLAVSANSYETASYSIFNNEINSSHDLKAMTKNVMGTKKPIYRNSTVRS